MNYQNFSLITEHLDRVWKCVVLKMHINNDKIIMYYILNNYNNYNSDNYDYDINDWFSSPIEINGEKLKL